MWKKVLGRLPVFPFLVFEIRTQKQDGSYVMLVLLNLHPEENMFNEF
jgi:hypothetical protein